MIVPLVFSMMRTAHTFTFVSHNLYLTIGTLQRDAERPWLIFSLLNYVPALQSDRVSLNLV